VIRLDAIAQKNRQYWTRAAASGSRYTRPWLELDAATVRAFADGAIPMLPEPCRYVYPASLFANVAGMRVLCLAASGGQQSVVFGLLGARVTVLDLTEAQLAADREAAAHHGCQIATELGDMRDLSRFGDGTFDLVYQAISICFVPDVRVVYREVARVLGAGGLYRVEHCNPATELLDERSWNGQGYLLGGPYIPGPLPDDEVSEFRHSLSDVFNGLIETGFVIRGVWEDPRHLHHDPAAVPGTEDHMLSCAPMYFAVLGEKPGAQAR